MRLSNMGLGLGDKAHHLLKHGPEDGATHRNVHSPFPEAGGKATYALAREDVDKDTPECARRPPLPCHKSSLHNVKRRRKCPRRCAGNRTTDHRLPASIDVRVHLHLEIAGILLQIDIPKSSSGTMSWARSCCTQKNPSQNRFFGRGKTRLNIGQAYQGSRAFVGLPPPHLPALCSLSLLLLSAPSRQLAFNHISLTPSYRGS